MSDKILYFLSKYFYNLVDIMIGISIEKSNSPLDKERFHILSSHFPCGSSTKIYDHLV